MSDETTKGIVEAVEQSDVYAEAMSVVSDAEKPNVQATLEGFAKLLSPMVDAVEQLERSPEVLEAVRARLAEKLRGG